MHGHALLPTHLWFAQVAVEDESKQRSTFSTLWRALAERWRRHKERRMEQDNLKMSERSSRHTTGFSTPVSSCVPWLVGWLVGWGAAVASQRCLPWLHSS